MSGQVARGPDGRWPLGQSGNPKGSSKNAMNRTGPKTRLKDELETKLGPVLDRAIAMAMGDGPDARPMLEFLLSRILPAAKPDVSSFELSVSGSIAPSFLEGLEKVYGPLTDATGAATELTNGESED